MVGTKVKGGLAFDRHAASGDETSSRGGCGMTVTNFFGGGNGASLVERTARNALSNVLIFVIRVLRQTGRRRATGGKPTLEPASPPEKRSFSGGAGHAHAHALLPRTSRARWPLACYL